jgi:hypothetical protein
LCAHAEPVGQAVLLDAQAFFATFGNRVVKPDALDETAIAADAFVSHNNIEKWTVFRTAARESDDDHDLSFGWRGEKIHPKMFLQRLRHTTWHPASEMLQSRRL